MTVKLNGGWVGLFGRKVLVVQNIPRKGSSVRPHLFSDMASRPPHDPILCTGVSVGASLCVLFLAWLLVANHMPFVDRFAQTRNLAAAAAAGVLLLVPVCRFLKSPSRLFLSGLTAWTLLTLAYRAMEARFPGLQDRMGTFHLFVLGSAAYGLLASIVWVAHLIILARQPPTFATRRRHP